MSKFSDAGGFEVSDCRRSQKPIVEFTSVYNETAASYQGNTLKLLPEHKAIRFLSYLPPKAKILDIGCGPGRDAKYFTELGFNVTGLDISEKMIELAKREVPNADFMVMDIENLNFAKNQFDAAWASASLLHVPKDKIPAVLQSIHNILKDEGIFFIALRKGLGEEMLPDNRYGGVEKFWVYFDEDELHDYLKKAGFEILESQTHDISTSYQTNPWISFIAKKI